MATCMMYVVAFVRAISFENTEDINKVTNAINQNVFLSAYSMSSTSNHIVHLRGARAFSHPLKKKHYSRP